MVDIQSATTNLASAASSSNTASTGLSAVQVAITDISQALADITHSIQTNATPIDYSGGSSLTLATALGNITVDLSQIASTAEQQNLAALLAALSDSQKSLTLSLQPDATQATLIVPNVAPVSLAAPQSAQPVLPSAPIPPLTVGETLPAVVLPPLSTVAAPVSVAGMQASVISAEDMPFTAAPVAASSGVNAAAAAQVQGAAGDAEIMMPQGPVTVASTGPVAVPLTANAVGQAGDAGTSLQATPQPGAQNLEEEAIPQTAQQPGAQAQTPGTQVMPSLAASGIEGAPQLNAGVQQNTLATLLQPGNAVSLRVDQVILPGTAEGDPALPVLGPNQIAATVTGTGTDGQLILKAGDATLFVKASASAPVGATVILTVGADKGPALLTLPQSGPINFPALPQAVAALAQADPQMFAQMMARLPQPTAALPGALLFLFSAFKQGNASEWLGADVTSRLATMGKADVVASIARELGGAGQTAQDPVVGDWKTYPIPLYSQQQFQALTLYVHGDRDARRDQAGVTKPGGDKVRFLIDMRLSKLGAMQIDGFVQTRKLDMILRSEALLPEGLHSELREAYTRALGAVGYAGTLNFQVGRQHWMMMQKPAVKGMVT